MRWTDDHCHLGDGSDKWPEAAATIADAHEAGVMRMITVGCDLASSKLAVEVASAYDGVWATAGVHPHDASGGIDGIAELLADPKVVAVGECGLDYHYDHSPRPQQRRAFADQLAIAQRERKAVVVHSREAADDTLAMVREAGEAGIVGVLTLVMGGSDDSGSVALVPDATLSPVTTAPATTPAPNTSSRNSGPAIDSQGLAPDSRPSAPASGSGSGSPSTSRMIRSTPASTPPA